MRIELFGIARARGGVSFIEIAAGTIAEALQALAQACPGLVPEVLCDGRLTEHFVMSLNGESFVSDPQRPLTPRDTLLILGAQAGG